MNILAVGAYERDNFGDLLFFIITKKYFSRHGINLTPSSIIISDMRHVLGEIVFPYTDLLENRKWDAVLVVGGEVGNVTAESALSMDIQPRTFENYKKYKDSGVSQKIIYPTGFKNPSSLAYVPDVTTYVLNREIPLYINSSGGFRSENTNLKRVINNTKVLGNTTFFSVRDPISSTNLKEMGVNDVRLVPDVVHLISKYFPDLKSEPNNQLLFQIKDKMLHDISIDRVVEQLSILSKELGLDVGLFAAGIAPGHDNLDSYVLIKDQLEERKIKTKIIQERDPLKLAQQIANSSLWVGSSLHGRIIASAYSIPRVSFDSDKLNTYIQKWDSEYPYGVKYDFVEYARTAMKTTTGVNAKTKDLESMAESNLDDIRKNLIVQRKAKDVKPFGIMDAIDSMLRLSNQPIQTLSEGIQYIDDLLLLAEDRAKIIERLESNIEKYKDSILEIKKSKTYRLGKIVMYVPNRLKKIIGRIV